MGSRPWSERVEASLWGKVLISALVVALAVVEVITNLPGGSALVQSLGPTANKVAAISLEESSWGVFAPNPRGVTIAFEARITFADGTETTWNIPTGWPVIENLRLYRWRKWQERAVDSAWSKLWEPTARWVADRYADAPSPVVQVQLVRQWHDDTVTNPQPRWQEGAYYSLDFHPHTSSKPR